MGVRRLALLVAGAVALLAAACAPQPPTTDTSAPTLWLPVDMSVPATSPSGATVTYAATATDDVDGTPCR